MLKRYPLALYITWILILGIVPLPLIFVLNHQLVSSFSDLLIYDFGLLAYVWWLVIIYLSTRPKWLDRLIGLPAMYFVHGFLGVLALVVAFLHRQLAFTYHEAIRLTGDLAFYLALFGILYASFFMSGWFVDRFPLAKIAKQKLQVFFKHQLSVWIHRLHFFVVGLIWLHVHLIPRIANLTAFILLFDIYTALAIGCYAYQKFVGRYAEKTIGTIVANESLSPTVQALTVALADKQAYQAGDFYFMRLNGKGLSKENHPFSVASSPDELPNQVRFMIQSVGDYTAKINQIPIGTKVYLEGPFGRFDRLVKQDPSAPLILYGLGSGIAPLYSMAKTYAPLGRQIHVIWSAKNEKEMYLHQDFQNLAEQYDNVIYTGKAHRFTQEELNDIMSLKEINTGQFFIVGSAQIVLKVEAQLNAMGIDKKRLHDERLTM
ncbi:ferric reductase [Streptococcus criceti]|uniref:Membrane protein n=1 Tax=Streptococcus criceti HS-6 TaxID=873449 RepID=G5JPB8_STRCG|nr:FAD-binding oxidoreductase [Streptococcus criceti]EHI74599.1 putative membrane protein [Streptococcus criceti HS-6]SUN43448.1 ferric reductase [Streptococcus criceti]